VVGEPRCYVGPDGSTATCPIDADGDVLIASASALGPHETVTVAIGFEAGTFRQSSQSASYIAELVVPLIPPVLMIGLLITAIIARLTTWRPPRGRGTKIVQYSPPDPEDLHLSAVMIDRVKRGLPAAIIGLAVARHVRIVDVPTEDRADSRFALSFLSDDGASQREQELLDALFGRSASAGEVCELDGQSLALARRLRVLEHAAVNRSQQLGLNARMPRRLKTFVRGWAWLAFFGSLAVAFFSSDALFDARPPWAWWLIAAGSFVVLVVIHRLASTAYQLTRAGHDYRDHLEGMREYLQLAEEDRLRMLQSPDGAERVVTGDISVVKLYEKLLPYAVLWGVEDQWSRELEIQYAATGASADWVAGDVSFSRGFAAGVIASSQSSASVPEPSTSSSYSSSGSSSSSGGSSGGGSSGGGGGGGGGGGW
jgi:uncharacterized membrane protein YgcG